jgi:hypothetical protein
VSPRRDRSLAVAGAVAIALAAGFAWLTRHPESPWIDRAAGWPVVGPLAASFRDRWRPPAPGVRAPEEPPEGVVLRVRIPEPPRDAPRPRDSSPPRPGAAGPDAPPDRGPEPPRPLPARAPDPRLVARALERLGHGARRSTLGPYLFVGDLDPPPRWAALAAAIDAAFVERYGLEPLGEPAETVVAFSRPEAYRAFQREEPSLATVDAGGFATSGLAALAAPDPAADGVEATLVHELAHLVARRALGPALPAWLGEGLAEDLAQTPFDADPSLSERGSFRWGALRGSIRREGDRIEIEGPPAAIDLLAAERDPISLAALVEAPEERFLGAAGPLLYARSLVLVRYLLDGGDPELAAGLRAYLAGVARGESAGRAALEARLGRPLDRLEGGFYGFLARLKLVEVDARVAALARPGERLRSERGME